MACSGPSHSGDCTSDSDCGGLVCARSGECLPASEVRMVKVTWTIRGAMAGVATCANSPDFYIQFDGASSMDFLGYEPVPCDAGQFVVDKLPTRFDAVEVYEGMTLLDSGTFGASGTIAFDLSP